MSPLNPTLDRYIKSRETTETVEGVEYLPGWYFHDETGDEHGPFETIDETRENLKNYCAQLGE